MDESQTTNFETSLLDSSDSQIDVHGILLEVLRSKRTILLLAFAFGIAVFFYVGHLPVTYQAKIEILPPQGRMSAVAALSGADSGLSALGAAVQAKTQVDSFAVILQAWPIQDGLVKRFNLVQVYGAPNPTLARYTLASRTTIVGTREGFINLSIIDNDKQRSADLANGYVDQVREFLRGLALSEASQRRQFYEGQLAGAKDALTKAEEAFRLVQQKNGLVSVDAQTQALLVQATGLRSQITAKEIQIQGLRGYSTANNPQVQIAESELQALRGQLSELESRGQGGYMGKSLSSVPTTELEFVRASRELKYQEGLYDLMVKQYEGSKLDEARDAPTIQVIEPALVPDHQFGPHKVRAGLKGFGIGFVIGLLVALFRYWRKQSRANNSEKWTEFRRALRWSA